MLVRLASQIFFSNAFFGFSDKKWNFRPTGVPQVYAFLSYVICRFVCNEDFVVTHHLPFRFIDGEDPN